MSKKKLYKIRQKYFQAIPFLNNVETIPIISEPLLSKEGRYLSCKKEEGVSFR